MNYTLLFIHKSYLYVRIFFVYFSLRINIAHGVRWIWQSLPVYLPNINKFYCTKSNHFQWIHIVLLLFISVKNIHKFRFFFGWKCSKLIRTLILIYLDSFSLFFSNVVDGRDCTSIGNLRWNLWNNQLCFTNGQQQID